MSPNLRSLVPPAVSLRDAEKANGCSPQEWFPPWSMEEEVWWCGVLCLWHCWGFLFSNWRHTVPAWQPQHPATTWHPTHHLFSNSTMTYMTKKEGDGVPRQVTWSTVTWPQPSRDGAGWAGRQSEDKRANKCSASPGTPSRLLENRFRRRPHEAHRKNAKSAPSNNQSKLWLLWRIWHLHFF